MIGLIGYTGTVGKTLLEHLHIDKCYNSSNISEIQGEEFDELYIAGIPANKWIANQDKMEDLKHIYNLIDNLTSVKSKRTVLISTIDVHHNDNYGVNRMAAEAMICNNKNLHCQVLRLPGLIGKHIKKNFIFDLAHPEKDLSFTSKSAQFMFMDLDKITDYLNFKEQVRELRSELVSAKEICEFLGIDISRLNDKDPQSYNFDDEDCVKKCLTKEDELKLIKRYIDEVHSITTE